MRYFPALLVIIYIALTACKKEPPVPQQATQAPPQALPVDVLITSPAPLNSDIQIPGSIMANETTEIHPEVAGRIVNLQIREGAQVAQGALLAKLYDGDLQAQLRKLEVQLQIAEQTEKRLAELVKIQGISQQEYDMSLLNVQTLKADMDIIRESIRKTEIRAPFNGRLGFRNVSPGAYVTPSDILTTIAQTNTLKIQFNVPERYSAQLKNGMPVSFTVDGSTKTFTASIIATEIQVEEATRSLAVRAVIKEKDAVLVPGTFAKVSALFGENEKALLIPNLAIIPQGRIKQVYLYKGGKAAPVEITTGVRDSSNIEVLTGLKAGDTLITSSILFLRPGIDVVLRTE